MKPDEVVGTTDQTHPSGEHRFLVGDGPAPSNQEHQGSPEGGVEPLNISSVDVFTPSGRCQDPDDGAMGPSHYLALRADHPPLCLLLDHPLLLNQVFVDPLAVLASSGPPVGCGLIIQVKGGDDSLHRTAVTQQGEHDNHQVRRLMQSVEGRPLGRGEGLAAPVAHIPAVLLIVDTDVPFPDLTTDRTVGVVTELTRRIDYRLAPDD